MGEVDIYICVCLCVCVTQHLFVFSRTCVGIIKHPLRCLHLRLLFASLMFVSSRISDGEYFSRCVCVIGSWTGLMVCLWNLSPAITPIAFYSHMDPTLILNKCMCVWGHSFCASLLCKNPFGAFVYVQNCPCLNELVNNQLVLWMDDLSIKQQRNMIYARICHSGRSWTEPISGAALPCSHLPNAI